MCNSRYPTNKNTTNRLLQLIKLTANKRADAGDASPLYRLRKTIPNTTGGMEAKRTNTSRQIPGEPAKTATEPASKGLKNNFKTITIPRGWNFFARSAFRT